MGRRNRISGLIDYNAYKDLPTIRLIQQLRPAFMIFSFFVYFRFSMYIRIISDFIFLCPLLKHQCQSCPITPFHDPACFMCESSLNQNSNSYSAIALDPEPEAPSRQLRISLTSITLLVARPPLRAEPPSSSFNSISSAARAGL